MNIPAPVIERFWIKIKKTDSCWFWVGCMIGYGRSVGSFRYLGKMIAAHRFSYLLHYGEFDRKLCVCHKCDNPSCVNPDHLFLGTQKDNMQDMSKKGRCKNWLADMNKRKTKCAKGHDYNTENTIRRKTKPNTRRCVICDKQNRTLSNLKYKFKNTKLYTHSEIFSSFKI